MGFVGDIVSDVFGGSDAEKAAESAAQTTAGAQREALDYLREREEIPQQFREGALERLGGIYDLPGGIGTREELIERARTSPFYEQTLKDAEEAIMRNAAMTGGFRSGNLQQNLADYSGRVLAEAYDRELGGLTQLAQLPSNAAQIAQQIAGVGRTLGQGEIAGAQARQQAIGTGVNAALGLGGLLLL